MILGTAVMHGSGTSFASNPAGFATQLIGLYENVLGSWSGLLVGVAAFAVMFSTMLTILDGFPRSLANLILFFFNQEESIDDSDVIERRRHTWYWIAMLVMIVGGLIIISYFANSLKKFIDISATISFLSAPVFAYLNHRAITSDEVPDDYKPSPGMQLWSVSGISGLAVFGLLYLYLIMFVV